MRWIEDEHRERAAANIGDETHGQEHGNRAMLGAPTSERPRKSHRHHREQVGGAGRQLLLGDDVGGLEAGERLRGKVRGLLILSARRISLDKGA